MKTQYFVYGHLDSGCSHGTHVSRETALRLLRKGRDQNSKMRRGSYGFIIDIEQHSLKELHKGYRYRHLDLAISRA